MSATSTADLVLDTLSTIGGQAFLVLTAVIGIAAAYFVFKWAWRRVKGGFR